MSERILRFPEVIATVGLKRSAIYERIVQGTFPAPRALGKRAVGWLESEVDKWVKARALAREEKHAVITNT